VGGSKTQRICDGTTNLRKRRVRVVTNIQNSALCAYALRARQSLRMRALCGFPTALVIWMDDQIAVRLSATMWTEGSPRLTASLVPV
jgi:hypothetical protein